MRSNPRNVSLSLPKTLSSRSLAVVEGRVLSLSLRREELALRSLWRDFFLGMVLERRAETAS